MLFIVISYSGYNDRELKNFIYERGKSKLVFIEGKSFFY